MIGSGLKDNLPVCDKSVYVYQLISASMNYCDQPNYCIYGCGLQEFAQVSVNIHLST
ncbi:unnamed protein product [Schistosoma curassoni]|uniref:Peptidase S1 domain-containing protein n=1 Tax=Schistosoma curassoni TaxID=6186 RepID=A0A183KWK8_9TREM|nr:unnamed protein product [Schistosoma curassoni]